MSIELQKLDEGTYIAETRKIQASAVIRTREAADKSWKIAAVVAAMVLAGGFTDLPRHAGAATQALGALAVLSWLVVVGLFIWVNVVPSNDDSAWEAHQNKVDTWYADEQKAAEASGDAWRQREIYAKKAQNVALSMAKARFATAATASFLAMALTALALGATIFGAGGRTVGTPLLTNEGADVLVAACPNLELEEVGTMLASVNAREFGLDLPVRLEFDPGLCANDAMSVVLNGELLVGLVE